jgi:hypothetical protein
LRTRRCRTRRQSPSRSSRLRAESLEEPRCQRGSSRSSSGVGDAAPHHRGPLMDQRCLFVRGDAERGELSRTRRRPRSPIPDNEHGGQASTLLALSNVLYHWGSVSQATAGALAMSTSCARDGLERDMGALRKRRTAMSGSGGRAPRQPLSSHSRAERVADRQRLPVAPPRGWGRRKRVARRRQVARNDHRRQPRRQVNPAAQPRPRSADDAVRDVRRCRFVPRERVRRSFTHYKREEDATMQRGKLDEELGRMSEIADQITPHSILLCNESFASTNEREGSEIAGQASARWSTSRSASSLLRTCTSAPTASTHNSSTAPSSSAPSASRTDDAPSSSASASHCRPATAKTPTGGSSARRSTVASHAPQRLHVRGVRTASRVYRAPP